MIRGQIRSVAVAGAVLGATAATGCAATAQPVVTEAAARFAAAVARHDGAAACALLTDAARRDVETFGRACAPQLAGLPDPGGVVGVEVWGQAAQVRLARDTVFLLRFPDGWRVDAAGCIPQGDAPYRCEVRG
jgi:hypothetical protein